MTLEVYPSVGDASKVSTAFTAKINGVSTEVLGFTRLTTFACRAWTDAQSLHTSWFTFGHNENAPIEITNIGGPITSFTIFPRKFRVLLNAMVILGKLYLTIPAGRSVYYLHIEVNGIANIIEIFPRNVSQAIPGGAINIATLPGSPKVLTAGQTGYFPVGVTTIGFKGLRAANDCTVIFQPGCYMIGTIDTSPNSNGGVDQRNILIRGGGVFSGEFIADPEPMTAAQKLDHSFVNGFDGIHFISTNCEIREVVMVAPIGLDGYWFGNRRIQVASINPWVHGSGGIMDYVPDFQDGGRSYVIDCFCFQADDAFDINFIQNVNNVVSRCYAVNANGACVNGGFDGETDTGTSSIVEDTYCYSLANPADDPALPEFDAALTRCWMDNVLNSQRGKRRVTFRRCGVDGVNFGAVVSLENKIYPFAPIFGQIGGGQIEDWLFEDIDCEFEPSTTFLGQLLGLDANNGIRNITFRNIRFGPHLLNDANFPYRFATNAFATSTIDNTDPVIATPVGPNPPNRLATFAGLMQLSAEERRVPGFYLDRDGGEGMVPVYVDRAGRTLSNSNENGGQLLGYASLTQRPGTMPVSEFEPELPGGGRAFNGGSRRQPVRGFAWTMGLGSFNQAPAQVLVVTTANQTHGLYYDAGVRRIITKIPSAGIDREWLLRGGSGIRALSASLRIDEKVAVANNLWLRHRIGWGDHTMPQVRGFGAVKMPTILSADVNASGKITCSVLGQEFGCDEVTPLEGLSIVELNHGGSSELVDGVQWPDVVLTQEVTPNYLGIEGCFRVVHQFVLPFVVGDANDTLELRLNCFAMPTFGRQVAYDPAADVTTDGSWTPALNRYHEVTFGARTTFNPNGTFVSSGASWFTQAAGFVGWEANDTFGDAGDGLCIGLFNRLKVLPSASQATTLVLGNRASPTPGTHIEFEPQDDIDWCYCQQVVGVTTGRVYAAGHRFRVATFLLVGTLAQVKAAAQALYAQGVDATWTD